MPGDTANSDGESVESRELSPDELAELLARHLPALRSYFRLNLPPEIRARESVDDLAQSVCREVLSRGPQSFEYLGERAFRSWLLHWATHKLLDRQKYYRAQKRKSPTVPMRHESVVGTLEDLLRDGPTPSMVAEVSERLELLERALDRLSPEDRQVIVLCRLAERPHREVAEVMDRSIGAIRMLLNRALVRLSSELRDLGVG